MVVFEEEYFVCTQCGQILPQEKKVKRQNMCIPCSSELARIKNKINLISLRIISLLIKDEVGCCRCGDHPVHYQLDFHHIRDKKYHMSHLIGQGRIDRFLEELPKCVLLCNTCHREEHWGGMNFPYNALFEEFT